MINTSESISPLFNLQDMLFIEILKQLHPKEILNLLIALGKHNNQVSLTSIKKIIHQTTVFLRDDINMAEYFTNLHHLAFLPFRNLTQNQQIKLAKAAIQNPNEFFTYLQSERSIEEKKSDD